jgi:diaminopimelate epimerase
VNVETNAGILQAVAGDDGTVSVDMGPANLDWQAIPLCQEMDTLALDLSIGGLSGPVAVNMGNPHAVFFVYDAAGVALEEIGPEIETHAMFPERTNVEVAQMLTDGSIRLRVWERGVGITRACGTGACATLVAASRRELSGRNANIILDGGALAIDWRDDNHVIMTGPVAPGSSSPAARRNSIQRPSPIWTRSSGYSATRKSSTPPVLPATVRRCRSPTS